MSWKDEQLHGNNYKLGQTQLLDIYNAADNHQNIIRRIQNTAARIITNNN